jgi:hypothetical protein
MPGVLIVETWHRAGGGGAFHGREPGKTAYSAEKRKPNSVGKWFREMT